MSEEVSNRVLTIPNAISFVRVLAVPVFWWILLGRDDVRTAAVLVAVIAWTDWVDGYLARRLNQVSQLGKTLDPVADRLMIASAVVGGLIADVVPEIIGIPLIARELLMGLVTLVLVRRGAGTLTVRYMGKVATAGLYGAIPSFYFAAAGVFAPLMSALAWIVGSIALVIYWAVTFAYLGDARRTLADVESSGGQEES